MENSIDAGASFVQLIVKEAGKVSIQVIDDGKGMSPQDALSVRELEVCRWAAEGKQVSDIAQILGITPRTVTFHLNNVVSKLGASSKSQAISWALKQGVVRLNVEMALVANVDEKQ